MGSEVTPLWVITAVRSGGFGFGASDIGILFVFLGPTQLLSQASSPPPLTLSCTRTHAHLRMHTHTFAHTHLSLSLSLALSLFLSPLSLSPFALTPSFARSSRIRNLWNGTALVEWPRYDWSRCNTMQRSVCVRVCARVCACVRVCARVCACGGVCPRSWMLDRGADCVVSFRSVAFGFTDVPLYFRAGECPHAFRQLRRAIGSLLFLRVVAARHCTV